jgi:hypothetical protein
MLRVVGLALLLVVGVAAPAEANDGRAGKSSAIAAYQDAATGRPRLSVHQPATPLPLNGAFTTAQSPLRDTSSAGFRRELVTPAAGLAAFPAEGRERSGSLALPWVNQGKSGLRLPVTERLSFAVGYRHLEPEDLSRRYAEAGSVDYDSHDFLLRAYWRF